MAEAEGVFRLRKTAPNQLFRDAINPENNKKSRAIL